MTEKLRICLDGRSLHLAGGTGVRTYAGVLAAAVPGAGCLLEVLEEGADRGRARRWAAAAFGRVVRAPVVAPGVRDGGDGFRVAQVRFDLRRGFLPLGDGDPPDVMHWTYPMPLRFLGVPNVYTVHDLIPLLHPSLTPVSPGRTRRLLAGLRRSGAELVTVSEASRREIVGLGWPAERVTNTYQAVQPGVPAPDLVAGVLGRLGLVGGGYFLHVGTVERRKNVGRLIDAHGASGVSAPLVLVGPEGWRASEELRPGARIVRVPWVDRETLSALIVGARAVLAPSLAEGFGLAIAEALALGTPVLTSLGGATEEVAGGAALLVDPLEVRAIAGGIAALDADAGLRGRLMSDGRRRALLFSLRAYAGRMEVFYDGLVRRPAGFSRRT